MAKKKNQCMHVLRKWVKFLVGQFFSIGTHLVIIRGLRPCPQAQFFLQENITTYLSCPKKGTFKGLAGVALSRGRDIPGLKKT